MLYISKVSEDAYKFSYDSDLARFIILVRKEAERLQGKYFFVERRFDLVKLLMRTLDIGLVEAKNEMWKLTTPDCNHIQLEMFRAKYFNRIDFIISDYDPKTAEYPEFINQTDKSYGKTTITNPSIQRIIGQVRTRKVSGRSVAGY